MDPYEAIMVYNYFKIAFSVSGYSFQSEERGTVVLTGKLVLTCPLISFYPKLLTLFRGAWMCYSAFLMVLLQV